MLNIDKYLVNTTLTEIDYDALVATIEHLAIPEKEYKEDLCDSNDEFDNEFGFEDSDELASDLISYYDEIYLDFSESTQKLIDSGLLNLDYSTLLTREDVNDDAYIIQNADGKFAYVTRA